MELTIEVKAKRTNFQELYQTLLALVPEIRKKNGLRKVNLNRDAHHDDVFIIFFDWEEPEHLKSYLRSNDGSALLGAIEVLSEKTKVKIGNNDSTEGTLALQQLRDENYRP